MREPSDSERDTKMRDATDSEEDSEEDQPKNEDEGEREGEDEGEGGSEDGNKGDLHNSEEDSAGTDSDTEMTESSPR